MFFTLSYYLNKRQASIKSPRAFPFNTCRLGLLGDFLGFIGTSIPFLASIKKNMVMVEIRTFLFMELLRR